MNEMGRYQSWKAAAMFGAGILGIFFVAIVALAVSGGMAPVVSAGPASQASYPADTITVQGSGSASGAPDVAYITLGMELRDPDVGAAVAAVNDGMAQVTDAIAAAGVALEDIQTVNFNVWSEETYTDQGPSGEFTYRVSSQVRATVRDISLVQAVLDAAIGAGANSIGGLNFGIDDSAALEQDARLAAIGDANQRAQAIADAIGVTLGDPVRVTEQRSGSPVYAELAYGLGGGGGGISEGQLSVTSVIEVEYAIVR